MSDPAGHYTDPLEDALSQGSQRVAQLASLLGAAGEVAVRARALRSARASQGDAQASRAADQYERQAYQQAKLRWAPAHDPDWLAHADLVQVAQAWSAAACYADDNPVAAAAQRKCEERLCKLHPFAMSRYDRLIGDGLSALDAMREAAPLFGRAAHARPGQPAPARHALDRAPTDGGSSGTWEAPGSTVEPDSPPDWAETAERRGRQIAERLQDRARARGNSQLGADDIAMLLEAATNLPDDIISQIAENAAASQVLPREDADVPAVSRGDAQSPRDLASPASSCRTAAQITEESFPYTAADALKIGNAKVTQASSLARSTSHHKRQQPRRPL